MSDTRLHVAWRISLLQTCLSCLFFEGNYWNAASFSSPASYLHFPLYRGETCSDVSFYFKTSSTHGVFLENQGADFFHVELRGECLKPASPDLPHRGPHSDGLTFIMPARGSEVKDACRGVHWGLGGSFTQRPGFTGELEKSLVAQRFQQSLSGCFTLADET